MRLHTSNIGITYKFTYKLSLYSEISAVMGARNLNAGSFRVARHLHASLTYLASLIQVTSVLLCN
jgi:hypothetical protein